MEKEYAQDQEEPRELQRVNMNRVGGQSGVDIQVSTAKMYPRSISKFKSKAMMMATLDPETAANCYYAIPRGGKTIEGPSARLAEIVASAWGNMRVSARVVNEDARFIYAESVAWDLETNTAVSIESKRRITNRDGRRYDDDMIAVTANAAVSIALRNSVFKIVPGAYTREIYEAARKCAAGDIKSLALRRGEMLNFFKRYGITEERILNTIGKAKVDDIDLDDIATLKGVATAIKDQETTPDDAFPEIKKEPAAGDKQHEPKTKADKVLNKIKPKDQEQTKDEVPFDASAMADTVFEKLFDSAVEKELVLEPEKVKLAIVQIHKQHGFTGILDFIDNILKDGIEKVCA